MQLAPKRVLSFFRIEGSPPLPLQGTEITASLQMKRKMNEFLAASGLHRISPIQLIHELLLNVHPKKVRINHQCRDWHRSWMPVLMHCLDLYRISHACFLMAERKAMLSTILPSGWSVLSLILMPQQK
jgi:hypothetical protein